MRWVLLLPAALLATLGSQTTNGVIVVDDPRPVAAAIQALERQFGVPITYEDPTYRYSGDSVDHTAIPNPTQRAIDPWRPVGGSWSSSRRQSASSAGGDSAGA